MGGVRDVLKDKVKLRSIAKSAFEAVDTDKSGFLDFNELEQVMKNVASDIGVLAPTKDEVSEVLQELDANGDGNLSLDEFQVFIEQVLELMANQDTS